MSLSIKEEEALELAFEVWRFKKAYSGNYPHTLMHSKVDGKYYKTREYENWVRFHREIVRAKAVTVDEDGGIRRVFDITG